MARDRSALAEALRDGPAAGVADARDHQRNILRHAGGLPVAPVAERPAHEEAVERLQTAEPSDDDDTPAELAEALLDAGRRLVS